MLPSYSGTATPLYRENLNKVNNKVKSFLLQKPPRFIRHPTNCLIYDNRMVIPNKLKHLVLDAIHHKQPGQVGMLALAKLVWWPHIHSEIVAKTQACKSCTDQGKNLKPLLPKSQLGSLPPLTEPNQEIQMEFAVPITFKKIHRRIAYYSRLIAYQDTHMPKHSIIATQKQL